VVKYWFGLLDPSLNQWPLPILFNNANFNLTGHCGIPLQPNTQEVEVGDQEFEASLDYVTGPCLQRLPTPREKPQTLLPVKTKTATIQ
jgi:hypothetical protein